MYESAVKTGGIAVVTGAASGVGRVAAQRFAQAGLDVILGRSSGTSARRNNGRPEGQALTIP